jgi:DNA-binding SARP family transcriptional activator
VFRSDTIVDVDLLIEELWGSRPPKTAQPTVRTHVYHLRRAWERQTGFAAPIRSRHPGYELQLGEDQVDVARFVAATDRARVLLDLAQPAEAFQVLGEALVLWCGPPLAGMPHGQVLAVHLRELDAVRSAALELRVEAGMRLGRHRQLLPDLRALTADHPLNEWYHAQLMDALHHAGRRAEALQAYQRLRLALAEELGLEPTEELRDLHRRILRGTVADGLCMARFMVGARP